MKHQKGQNHYTLIVAETLEKRVEYLRVLRAYIAALRIAATPEVRETRGTQRETKHLTGKSSQSRKPRLITIKTTNIKFVFNIELSHKKWYLHIWIVNSLNLIKYEVIIYRQPNLTRMLFYGQRST